MENFRFISEEQLIRDGSGLTQLFESNNRRTYSISANQRKIFLSHKHTDVNLVRYVSSILLKEGCNIYVDWKDKTLPDFPNQTTAMRIKSEIQNSQKFILLATNDAINSKWCNWELGIADALKYGDLALFSVQKDNSWQGSEYMQLYPIIGYDDWMGTYVVNIPRNAFEVGKRMSLSAWLNK